jgi:hypothetical protein
LQSEARIKAEAEDDDYEKLCNVGAIDGDEPLARIMTDRYIVTG